MYQIKDWDRHFENAASKRVLRMEWVPIKNKHDGKGYRRLMAHPQAAEIFGAWMILIEVASKMPKRGILADEDGELDATDISDATGFNVNSITLALNVLSDPRIGWIISAPNISKCLQTFTNDHEQPTGKGREGKRREKKGREVPVDDSGNDDCDKPGAPEIEPEARWKMERLEPWAKRLASCCGTLGAKTWQIYKAIVDRYGLEQTERVARNMIGKWKWPDDLARILSEIEPGEEVPQPKPLSWQSVEAIRIYETQGSAVIRRVLEWHDVEECNIRYGLEDKENAEYLLANMQKAAV